MSFPQHLFAVAWWIHCSCLIWSCIQQTLVQVQEWHSRKALSRLTIVATACWKEKNESAHITQHWGGTIAWQNKLEWLRGETQTQSHSFITCAHFFLYRLMWTEVQRTRHTDVHLQSHMVNKNATTSDGDSKQSCDSKQAYWNQMVLSIVPFHSIHILWLHLERTICLHILGKCLHSLVCSQKGKNVRTAHLKRKGSWLDHSQKADLPADGICHSLDQQPSLKLIHMLDWAYSRLPWWQWPFRLFHFLLVMWLVLSTFDFLTDVRFWYCPTPMSIDTKICRLRNKNMMAHVSSKVLLDALRDKQAIMLGARHHWNYSAERRHLLLWFNVIWWPRRDRKS